MRTSSLATILCAALLLVSACKSEQPATPPATPPVETTPPPEVAVEAPTPTPVVEEPAAAEPPSYRTVDLANVQASFISSGPSDGLADEDFIQPTALAGPAYEGAIGPFDETTVYVPRSATGPQLWTLSVEGESVMARRTVLEPAYAEFDVKDLFFEDIDGDGVQDILMRYTYMTGVGPDGAVDQPGLAALSWDKESGNFVSRPEWVEGMEQLESADAVRAALKAKQK